MNLGEMSKTLEDWWKWWAEIYTGHAKNV